MVSHFVDLTFKGTNFMLPLIQ